MSKIFSKLKVRSELVVFLFIFLFFLIGINIHPFWRDEAWNINVLNYDIETIFKILLQDFHQPLHTLVLFFFSKIFEINEFTMRLPSAIFGLLGAYFFYKILREFFQKNISLLGTLLIGVNTFYIYNTQEARSYALLYFLVIALIFFFIKFLQKREFKFLYLQTLFSIFALYTHNSAVIPVMFFGVISIIIIQKKIKNLRKILLIGIFFVISLIPWIHFVFNQLLANEGRTSAEIYYYFLNIARVFFPYIDNRSFALSAIVVSLIISINFFFVISGIYFLLLKKRSKSEINKKKLIGIIFLAFISFTIITSIFLKLDITRYIGYILFPVTFFVVVGFENFKRFKFTFILVAVLILLNIFFQIFFVVSNPLKKEDIRLIETYVIAESLTQRDAPNELFSFDGNTIQLTKFYTKLRNRIVGDRSMLSPFDGRAMIFEEDFVDLDTLYKFTEIWFVGFENVISKSKDSLRDQYKIAFEKIFSFETGNLVLLKWEKISE